jgi:hypothetical protein
MQPVRVSAVLAGLILLGALPAAAQSPEHTTYLEKARTDLQDWRRQLDAFDARVETEGQADGRAAADRLNLAWARTQTEAAKLQAAGADGWERAKASFEDTSREFTESFDKVRPQHTAPATP